MTPPVDIGYRRAKRGEPSCASCKHHAGSHCSQWDEPVGDHDRCDDHEAEGEAEVKKSVKEALLSEQLGLGEGDGSALGVGELFLSADGEMEERDGLLWATVLPVGEWQLTPGPNGRPVKRPLRVHEGSGSDAKNRVVGLADLKSAFDRKIVQHVTVPLTHADRPEENTGIIEAVEIGDDPKTGKRALRAGFKFTEPEIEGKVRRGSIRGRSAGILFDYFDKVGGERFPVALGHVALTNKPWITGMPTWGDDGVGFSEGYTFAEDAVLDAVDPLERLCDTLDAWSKGDLEVVLLDPDARTAVVRDADGDIWSVPVDAHGMPSPTDDWTLTEALAEPAATVPLDNNFAPPGGDRMGKFDNMTPEQLKAALVAADSELAASRSKDREAKVDEAIVGFSEAGLDKFPGVLKIARDLMLADNGEAAVLLSEDGVATSTLTSTEIVEKLLGAFTGASAELGLSEQHERGQAGKKPETSNAGEQKSARERADEMRETLGIQRNLISK